MSATGYRSVSVHLDGSSSTVTNSTHRGDRAARELADNMHARNFAGRAATVTIDDGARVVDRYRIDGAARCPHRLHLPDQPEPIRCALYGTDHLEHVAGTVRWSWHQQTTYEPTEAGRAAGFAEPITL